MTELLDLCYDILIRILEELDPEDLAACAKCCCGLNNFIKDNRRLFKAMYLKNFDDPRTSDAYPELQWEKELPKIIRCKKILESKDVSIKQSNFDYVAETINDLVTSSNDSAGPSRNLCFLIDNFARPLTQCPRNVDTFLCRSSLFKETGTDTQIPADTEEQQQLSAKLHCYFGIPMDSLGRRSLSTHKYARARVYDLRNYTDDTHWGPFRDDGSFNIDWEMVEAIMIDLGYNSRLFNDSYGPSFKPVWADAFGGVARNDLGTYPVTLLKEPDIPLDLKDPYSVSGDWMRIVCFLDYNDLYAFNFSSPHIPGDQPRPPIMTEEAIRHIIMGLKVTKVEPAGQFDNQALPIVHFSGFSQSLDSSWDPNANSRIRGSVRLTPAGEVRWQTISVFHGGEERWRSEGIQIGGPRSKRGVIGTWFDKDFDPHGPAGPTAFWKLHDKLITDTDSSDEESD